VLLDRRVDNQPAALSAVIEELRRLGAEHGDVRVGIDVVGGIAGLLTAMLCDAQIPVAHVSGLAVNRARQGGVGGEHKSDPKDAGVIADRVRHRRDLRPIDALNEIDAEIRPLVGRRRELVADQTRRISRLRDPLASIFPGLERITDPGSKASLQLLSRFVTPGEIRRAGRARPAP
jgi:Transposase